jgi:hypothetical protein
VIKTQGQLACLIVGVGLNRQAPPAQTLHYPEWAVALATVWPQHPWPHALVLSQKLGHTLATQLPQLSVGQGLADYHYWVNAANGGLPS